MTITLVAIKKRKSESEAITAVEPVSTDINELSPSVAKKAKQPDTSKTAISLVGLKKRKSQTEESKSTETKSESIKGKKKQETEQIKAKLWQVTVDTPTEAKPANVTDKNKLKPEAIAPVTEAEPVKTLFFQAVGLIKGTVQKGANGKLKVTFEGQTWKLYGSRKLLEKIPEKTIFLIVYPLLSDGEVFGFRAIAFKEEQPEGWQINHFTLRGVWQFTHHAKRPVITIYRNRQQGDWDECKPLHIPILWENPPVAPFRFLSELKEGESKPERYFVQVYAQFESDSGFYFESMLGEPTTKIPKHLKKQVAITVSPEVK